ncbi:MAG: hypothetical protein PHQ23_15150 [Candidatus Wallbacteria bacterium]|nr:hypothetical protein [Candidatus Wallbacteria bacterium]
MSSVSVGITPMLVSSQILCAAFGVLTGAGIVATGAYSLARYCQKESLKKDLDALILKMEKDADFSGKSGKENKKRVEEIKKKFRAIDKHEGFSPCKIGSSFREVRQLIEDCRFLYEEIECDATDTRNTETEILELERYIISREATLEKFLEQKALSAQASELMQKIRSGRTLDDLPGKLKDLRVTKEFIDRLLTLESDIAAASILGFIEEKSRSVFVGEKERLEKCRDEIRDFHRKIIVLDREAATGLDEIVTGAFSEKFEPRLDAVRLQVQAVYQSLKKRAFLTKMRRDELENMTKALVLYGDPGSLGDKLSQLRESELITDAAFDGARAEFQATLSGLMEEKMKAEVAAKLARGVSESLCELGYNVDDGSESDLVQKLGSGEVVYLDSAWDGYRVMLRYQGDELVVRLVRVVATEAERQSTEYQLQKDYEIAEKWCADYDRFLQKLHSIGLPLDVKLRKEPGEEHLTVIVDQQAALKSATGFSREHKERKIARTQKRSDG